MNYQLKYSLLCFLSSLYSTVRNSLKLEGLLINIIIIINIVVILLSTLLAAFLFYLFRCLFVHSSRGTFCGFFEGDGAVFGREGSGWGR